MDASSRALIKVIFTMLDSTKRPPYWPLATCLVLGALALVFEVEFNARAHTGMWPEPLPGLWVLDGRDPRWWHYFTYAWIHGDATHLRSNLVLLAFGMGLLEWRVKSALAVTLFFVQSIAVAVLFHLASPLDLYGASGVAYGLGAMASVLWIGATNAPRFMRITPALITSAYIVWAEVLPALTHAWTLSWLPHAVGVVSGALIARLLLRQASPDPTLETSR